MDRFRTAFGAAILTVLTGSLLVTPLPPLAKEPPNEPGIAPAKVADYVHAILQADRTLYTTHVVTRMQEKGIVKASEHWEQDNALPLPAQFLQHSGRIVAESGRGIIR